MLAVDRLIHQFTLQHHPPARAACIHFIAGKVTVVVHLLHELGESPDPVIREHQRVWWDLTESDPLHPKG